MRSLFKAMPLLLLLATQARAFPELIRAGYQSCKLCHYQPQGGGPITAYGRGVAGDYLSTFGSAAKGETFYGLFNIAPLGIGGDLRYLVHHYADESVEINQKFPMQKEVSVTFDPAKNVSFVASGGLYGFEPREMEYRRYFVNVKLGGLSGRMGRFLPAFGYEHPDHTKGVKELFGQGKESFNFETVYTHRYFEVFATRVLGSNSRVEASDQPLVRQKDERDGFTGKLTLFPTAGVQMGGSFASLEGAEKVRTYSGAHIFIGSKRLYSMGEYQWWPEKAYRAYGMVGVEVFKGFHVKAEYDADEQQGETFGTVQWFPYAHFEFVVSASEKQWLAISHYYL